MYKLSIVGIDNTGKTSIVRALSEFSGISTIHLTNCKDNCSRIASISGRLVERLVEFGEYNDLKFLTGLAYLAYLFPYKIEERTKRSCNILVSDRDPIIDPLCYFPFYLPIKMSKLAKPLLQFILEHSFQYPDSFIYLEVIPEESVRRNQSEIQLHERTEVLSNVKELFDEKMFSLERNGMTVKRIDTSSKSLEEVIEEVHHYLKKTKII